MLSPDVKQRTLILAGSLLLRQVGVRSCVSCLLWGAGSERNRHVSWEDCCPSRRVVFLVLSEATGEKMRRVHDQLD